MTFRLDGPPLRGCLVRLEPLTHAHAADLAAAAGGDGSTFGFTGVPAADKGEEGRLRDPAMFSVVAEEWPACRDRLRARVARRLPG